MLAISQSGNQYHYLNWIPSESGPMVTHHGVIEKESEDINSIEQCYFNVLNEIISTIDNREPICTFSLDNGYLLFSTNYQYDQSSDLMNWYQSQVKDQSLADAMEYYHYPMSSNGFGQLLCIGVPKIIRQSLQFNIRKLKARLNGIGAGIFSAEVGARQWFHADELESYIIWKIGKKKNDELLSIKNNELLSYFSISRSGKKVKINWQYGQRDNVEMIRQYINTIANDKTAINAPADKVFIYTCNDKKQDIKNLIELDIANMVPLNPLQILKMAEEKKISTYDGLSLAETGNGFSGIDV